jgi:transcription initiation factor TFIIIB Brf1 subunit/transcription initiation factor TFIIB
MQHRTNVNKKELINLIYQYEGHKPPMNIINTACELFDQILKKGYKYRENRRKGIFGACLYYACIEHNLTRAPKEIAAVMRIEERFLSQGDKLLQELNEYGIINIPTSYEPLSDYINQYFPTLGIPQEYKRFVIDLISRAEVKHLHVENESRTTSKCIGIIYLLTRRIPSLRHITKNDISKKCNNISKTTFLRYYQIIMDNHRVLKKVFKRHGVPMPREWKESK